MPMAGAEQNQIIVCAADELIVYTAEQFCPKINSQEDFMFMITTSLWPAYVGLSRHVSWARMDFLTFIWFHILMMMLDG